MQIQTGNPSGATPAPATVQARYLYYWEHDANFTLAQCTLLPPALWQDCQAGVQAQLKDPAVAHESLATREQYVAQYRQQADFPTADCPLLPTQYVASCLAEPPATADLSLRCTGVSDTVCQVSPGTTVDGSPALAFLLGNRKGLYQGRVLAFPSDPSLGVRPYACPLSGAGPTLVFSNDPERVPGPGILYEDTVQGAVRVYLYHENASTEPLYFGALVSNPGRGVVVLTVTRQGAAGPSTDFLAVGKEAEHQWFQTSGPTTVTLMPGQSAFLGDLIERAVPPGQAVNGIYDFDASGPVRVATVAEAQPSTDIQGLAILPNTQVNAVGTPMRGTFPHADLACQEPLDLSAAGSAKLSFGTGDGAGEYLRGRSAVDGTAAVDYGNYGVLYQLDLQVRSSIESPWSTYAVLLHPTGNPFAATAAVSGGQNGSGIVPVPLTDSYVQSADDAVLLDTYRFVPMEATSVHLAWMAAAASSLPVDVLVYPVS